jgi:hypothetical protein
MTLRAVASASPGELADGFGPTAEVADVSAAMCFSGAGVRMYTPWPVPGSACTPPRARGAEARVAAGSAVREWFVETLGDAVD